MTNIAGFFLIVLFTGIVSIDLLFDASDISSYTTDLLKPYTIQLNNHQNVEFEHNFCESRLQNNTPPERWNAYTSFIISVVPLCMDFQKTHYFTMWRVCYL